MIDSNAGELAVGSKTELDLLEVNEGRTHQIAGKFIRSESLLVMRAAEVLRQSEYVYSLRKQACHTSRPMSDSLPFSEWIVLGSRSVKL